MSGRIFSSPQEGTESAKSLVSDFWPADLTVCCKSLGQCVPSLKKLVHPQISHLCASKSQHAITTPTGPFHTLLHLISKLLAWIFQWKKKKLKNWKVTCLKSVTKKTADLTHTLQLYLTGVSKLMQCFPLTLEVTSHRSSNGIASIRTSCLSSNGGHKVPLCHYIPLNSHALWRHPFPLGNIL